LATALTYGKIYVLNWAPGSSDPDNYDLDGKTEGTDYVEIEKPKLWTYRNTTMKKALETPRGSSGANVITASGFFSQTFSAMGVIRGTSLSNALTKEGYWQTFNYTERTDTSLYLAVPYASNVYKQFYDTSGEAIRQYCQGVLIGEDFWSRWRSLRNLEIEVGFTFKASW
jgi:hypothetical protein